MSACVSDQKELNEMCLERDGKMKTALADRQNIVG